jgi:extracellular factor (EF) 3-hydroxypalmitic acid methyl ester biosynthesis protein
MNRNAPSPHQRDDSSRDRPESGIQSLPRALTREQNPGAVHAELVAAAGALRFRPQRLSADDFRYSVTCYFVLDGRRVGPLRVMDASPTGVGVAPENVFLAPGSALDAFEIYYRDAAVWTGSAVAVYQVDSPHPRVGVRFTSGLFDIQRLRVSDSRIGDHMDRELSLELRYASELPAEFRSDVGHVRQLLRIARDVLEQAEDAADDGVDERAVIETLFAKWGPRFHQVLAKLHRSCSGFDETKTELGRNLATRELLPDLHTCPMHSRAYDKPLGYAGDYKLMTLYFDHELSGASLYAKFLHYAAQHYALGRTVVAREQQMREQVARAIKGERPTRIVSLASGPAIEIQNLLGTIPRGAPPVEIILIDQDKEALQYCHEHLTRELIGRHRGQLPVSLHYLHFSVRQLLKPSTATEVHVVANVLKDADLIYSAGLMDYLPQPVAQKLLAALFDMLAPGGRLYIGNLREAPDTTWMLEYVLSWHLVYRTPEMMTALAAHLTPSPAEVAVRHDPTGLCMFLEVRR